MGKKVAAGPKAAVVLKGSSVHPATFDIQGKAYALGDIVGLAFKSSGLTEEAWNAQADADVHAHIDAELEKLSQPQAKDSTKTDDLKDGIFVRSVPESFRRCGYSFSRAGMGIALDLLTEDELEILQSEPNLVVEYVQFPMTEQD